MILATGVTGVREPARLEEIPGAGMRSAYTSVAVDPFIRLDPTAETAVATDIPSHPELPPADPIKGLGQADRDGTVHRRRQHRHDGGNRR